MWKLLVAVGCVGPLVAAPVPKDFKKKLDDKVRILGTWVLASANVNGKVDPNYFWYSMTFNADGTNYFRYRAGADQHNDFKLDSLAKPKMLSFHRNGAIVGHPRPYAFRDGRLVVAVSIGDQKRLDSVEPGPGVIVLEYERLKGK